MFLTTRWSVVLSAGDPAAPQSRAALETLCETYWYPLYAYARRGGRDADAAQDAVQGFFAHLLEKGALGRADPERGRFRAFLLASFRNHASHEAARGRAAKRGGGRVVLSLDPEERFRLEPAHAATPERLFDRDWAVAVLDAVMARLRASYREKGKEAWFDALKGCLVGDGSYAGLAERLGTADGALRVAVHRLRARYREELRAVIADTLAEGEDPADEMRALFAALAPL